MFKVNDTVMYGRSGVCRIVDICKKNFINNELLYYVLQPVYENKCTIYCPVDSKKVQMRKLLDIDEIRELIRTMPDEITIWDNNDRARRETYDKIIKSGDHRELIKLIKTLYLKRKELNSTGKKFHIADEKAMNDAEKLLYQEFALVLDIQLDEVVPFITGQIEVSGGN